jgi:hypothetical protein
VHIAQPDLRRIAHLSIAAGETGIVSELNDFESGKSSSRTVWKNLWSRYQQI